MKKYITKRVLLMIPILLGVTFLVFLIMSLLPGDPGRMILGMGAKAEDVAAYNHKLGVDRPFLIRFVSYIGDLLRGSFGISYRSQRPVIEEIAACFPYTLRLAIAGSIAAYLIGIPLGLISALKQNSPVDVAGTVVSMLLASVPQFWLGLMMILLFSLHWKLFPTSGVNSLSSYVMPVLVIALPEAAITSRLTRHLHAGLHQSGLCENSPRKGTFPPQGDLEAYVQKCAAADHFHPDYIFWRVTGRNGCGGKYFFDSGDRKFAAGCH